MHNGEKHDSNKAVIIVKTWKDLIKVHSRLRIPSDRFSSLTRRITRKSRKKVMDTEAFSEACEQKTQNETKKLLEGS